MAETLFLSAAALVLSLGALVGLAALRKRARRAPAWVTRAVMPNIETMNRLSRLLYGIVAIGFLMLSQGLLLVALVQGTADAAGSVVIACELLVVAIVGFMLHVLREPGAPSSEA